MNLLVRKMMFMITFIP